MNVFKVSINFLLFLVVILTTQASAQRLQKLKITELSHIIKTSDSVLIINFWATFCKPCVAEIPDLIKYSRKFKQEKAVLYLVSLDLADYYPKKIKQFTAKKKITSPIAWLDESNADYFCPIIDTSWSGSIPATLIVNNKKGYKRFYEKQLTASEIEMAIKEAL